MLELWIQKIYAWFDKGWLKILCLLMALLVAGYIFWEPNLFTVSKGVFRSLWQVYFIIWMVCAGLIYGSGIALKNIVVKVLCFPPLVFIVLLLTLLYVGKFIF